MTSPTNFPGAGRGEAQDVLRTVVTQIVGDALAEHDPVRAEQPAELRQSPALPQRRCGVTRYRAALCGARRRGRQPYGTSAQFRTYDASRASGRTGRGTAPPRACAESVAAVLWRAAG